MIDIVRYATSPFMQSGAWLCSFAFLGLEFAFEGNDWVNRGIGRESPQPSNRKIELLLT